MNNINMSLNHKQLIMKKETKINYCICTVWEDTDNHLSTYSYHSEVHYGTIKDAEEFKKYVESKKPDDIPVNPNTPYNNKGWLNWGDWLGTGIMASRLRKYRPFKEARKFARSLGLNSQTEWFQYAKGTLMGKVKMPTDIPYSASQIYKDKGWIGWRDWIGNT